jgi:hypothetical protein
MLKCPQADGSIISVPGTTCPAGTIGEKSQIPDYKPGEDHRTLRWFEQQEAQQRKEAFMQASAMCHARNRGLGVNARPDGTVSYVGTARQRWEYEACMERSGFRLTDSQ